MTESAEAIPSRRAIDTLALDTADVANSLDSLADIDGRSLFTGNPYDLKPILLREKHDFILTLLEKRAQIPNSGVLITLFQYPGETFNPFSQNVSHIDFAKPIPGNPGIHTELNRVGEKNGLDSLQVLKLIGEPDEVIDIDAKTYIEKSHEEMSKVQEAYRFRSNEQDLEACQYLDYLRYHLASAILAARETLPPGEARETVTVGMSLRQDLLLLSFGEDPYAYRINLNQHLFEQLAAGKGVDYWIREIRRGQSEEVWDHQPKIIRRLRAAQAK
jgi:hypothetical protein